MSPASPPSVLSHSQIHMPLPVMAATCEVHGAGAFTGGRDVTRTAGVPRRRWGREWRMRGHRAPGQQRRGWGSPVVSSVWVGAPSARRGRVEAGAGRTRDEATEPEPRDAERRGGPDVPAIVATAATAMATSPTEARTHTRFARTQSTVHCRNPAGQALGTPAAAVSSRRGSPAPSSSARRSSPFPRGERTPTRRSTGG